MKTKVTTLDNLREILELMDGTFGNKELSISHRNALNAYILNINYEDDLEFDTEAEVTQTGSSSILGMGKLGMMTLTTSYAPMTD